MLIESTAHLPVSLAMLQDIFHAPDGATLARIIIRWAHFVGGITWIGLLYFFNLVNVPFQKEIDAPTKGKVNPPLLSRSLWFFRWGAVLTVLAGLMYFAMYYLAPDTNNANSLGNAGANTWLILIVWLLIPVITFAIEYVIITKAGINDGRVLAVIVAVLAILMAVASTYWLNSQLTGTVNGRPEGYASNHTLSIGIGGGLGIIMLLNVWGIIWPNQKRIINWTRENAANGTAIPPESAALGRKAFLASRANAWLSLPMLLFMATAGHYVILGK